MTDQERAFQIWAKRTTDLYEQYSELCKQTTAAQLSLKGAMLALRQTCPHYVVNKKGECEICLKSLNSNSIND